MIIDVPLKIELSRNALQVLERRYLQRDTGGEVVETPQEMFRRVAKTVASAELSYGDTAVARRWESKFYQALTSLTFLPNSPALMNAGLPRGQLSACFVLPVEDSLADIFQTLKNAALIHQSGGGAGYNFSALRPKGDSILTTGGSSSGPVSFIRLFNAATEFVKQGGRRRGANMGILDINHVDIREFATIKSNPTELRNFNLSVWLTNKFMHAVLSDEVWSLVNPRTHQEEVKIPAKELWDLIVHQAWLTGDPGLLFADAINEHNPTPALGPLHCTNPCGELPLYDYESCNLASIHLGKMLKKEDNHWTTDWALLDATIETAIRFLDNAIDINYYTLDLIKMQTLQTRKIGLGVMGWAEMLIQLNIPYASVEAVQFADRLMHHIQIKSREVSTQLAETRGTFPAWEQSKYHPVTPLRNATCTSIAPTGSISIIADTTASIEPMFAVAFKRMNILGNETQMDVNKQFLNMVEVMGLWTDTLADEIYKVGSVQNLPCIPKTLSEIFQCSHEISWEWHLRHQTAFQQHTDNAVSKTINLPHETTEQDVHEAFMHAWRSGLKGVTIYRDGSKTEQYLQTGKSQEVTCC
ncbi:MAG: adenosylcobalamin-dependent ribonucleoside-diphosphate reductase [Saprospiraceae bacterium]|nr:adenosylcobalamin-dependent ribonucleoside-diphosphate reductase [Saprospiraceae bacterium]